MNKASKQSDPAFADSAERFADRAFFFSNQLSAFFIVGAFAGFSLSGAQAVSRKMVSQLAPEGKTTEFYGFLSVAGRTINLHWSPGLLVPFLTVCKYYVNHGLDIVAAEKAGQYWGIGSILAFLVIGMIILLSVREVTASEPMIYHNNP